MFLLYLTEILYVPICIYCPLSSHCDCFPLISPYFVVVGISKISHLPSLLRAEEIQSPWRWHSSAQPSPLPSAGLTPGPQCPQCLSCTAAPWAQHSRLGPSTREERNHFPPAAGSTLAQPSPCAARDTWKTWRYFPQILPRTIFFLPLFLTMICLLLCLINAETGLTGDWSSFKKLLKIRFIV